MIRCLYLTSSHVVQSPPEMARLAKLGVCANINYAYHTHPRPHPKIKDLLDNQDGVCSIFQVLPLSPCGYDKEFGIVESFKGVFGIQLQVTEDIE